MSGSVSRWVSQLQSGDRQAVGPIWQRYIARLVGFARRKLGGVSKRMADEEDVAMLAFESFCRGAEQGRFPQLRDRRDLWSMLVLITARKAANQAVYEKRQKRAPKVDHSNGEFVALDDLPAGDATPEFYAQAAEAYHALLQGLPDDTLRRIAEWKMQNFSNEEIALKMDCSERTVERKLNLIRHQWKGELLE